MKIDRIDLFHVAMPLIYPWRTAYGEDAACHSVLCRMTSGSLHAWGESAPLAAPCYSPEWAGGIFAVAKSWLAPAIVRRDVTSGEELQSLLAVYKGNPFAKALLDVAWWNLSTRARGVPLHRLLGATRDRVPVGADFGVMDSVGDLLESIGQAVDRRFPRIKLKFRPGWDVGMLAAVRGRFPHATFHIDCNSGYRFEDLPMFRRIDEFGLAMIEQPLAHDDVVDHARLQAAISTPVCLDESVSHPRHAVQALALKACRFVNIKPGRVGGLTNALAIHNLCRDAGVPCWVGGMLESATGAGVCAALAMLDNFTYPADIFPSSRFYHQDLAERPLELTTLSDGTPGVEAFAEIPEPNAARLETLCLERATIV
ncbi:MAG: o-succinylbenzoate synthase [Planctomycetia bacterium]|nr:o-succinylbenzoate synthase [Planctomycetia bacterium]